MKFKRLFAALLCAAMLLTLLPAAAFAAADMGDESSDIPVKDIVITTGNQHPGNEVQNALDGNPDTIWHTSWYGCPLSERWVILDLGRDYPVSGLRILPRQDQTNGMITQYTVWGSTDGVNYVPVASGDWDQTHDWKSASFGPYTARYIKLEAATTVGEFASAAEIRVTQAAVSEPYSTASFTEEAHGGWNKDAGPGTMSFADGKMEFWANNTANGDSYFSDAEAPALANGYIETVITPVTTARFGVLYRYQSASSFTGVLYDTGAWLWAANGGSLWGGLTADQSVPIEAGKAFTLRVQFQGSQVEVYVDGTLAAHGTIDNAAVSQEAGRVGVRVWGDGPDDSRGHIRMHSLEMGVPQAKPLPEPEAPVEPQDEYDENGNLLITFTDAARRGGLQRVSGDGFVEFHDGEGDQGYAIVAKEDVFQTKAYFVVDRSPMVADGFLEADVTNQADGRCGLNYRVQEDGSYLGIAYDVGGSWSVMKNGRNIAPFDGGSLPGGQKKHIRLDFAGNYLAVTIDGNRVLSQVFPEFEGTQAGKVGAVVWGYADGGNQGQMMLDNIVIGEQIAVEVLPSEYTLSYKEAGSTALRFTMGSTLSENPVQGVTLAGKTLELGRDYTIEGSILRLEASCITPEIKDASGAELHVIFEDGFTAVLNIIIQSKPQEHQISYVRDFTQDPTAGENPLACVSGSANLTYDSEKQALVITNPSNAIIVDPAAPLLKNCDVEVRFNLLSDSSALSVLGRQAENYYVAVGGNGSWRAYSPDGSQGMPSDWASNTMFGNRTVPYTIRARFLEKNVTLWVDNYEVWSGPVSAFRGSAGLPGVLVSGGPVELLSLSVTSVDLPEAEEVIGQKKAISSDDLKVTLDRAFPRVIGYEMDGKTLPGQEIPYYVVELNNKQYVPQVTSQFDAGRAVYHLTVSVTETENVTFDVVFTVEGNVLKMTLTSIDDSAYPVYNINFPCHSLVSMPSDRAGAELRAANYTAQEVRLDLTTQPGEDMYRSASIVVLSCDDLAAAINNESYNGHRGISYQTMRLGEKTTTGLWSTGLPYRGLDNEIMFPEPWVKVSITGDRNQDGKVDFQDAAISRRDDCHKDGQQADAYGYEAIMNSYVTIGMNVGSSTHYPFLRILDNIKKVSLGMDNFPQTVLIKGYNGQGHDSNNNDFTCYNEAAGGLRDFNTLLENSEAYNTKIGIHINETEVYPESATYGRLKTSHGGWSWYDNAAMIHYENDALDASQEGMLARLDALNRDTNNNLDFIYVDVYGRTRWPMYRLTSKINSMGIAVGTEYPSAMDKQSVWAHQVGGYVTQDNVTGNLLRFVNNQYQDIFGGSPLFRGTSRVAGINGWQNASNYYGSMEHFYTSVLPNRFLTQYPVMQWESSDRVVLGDRLNVVTKIENGVNVITLDGNDVVRGNLIFIPFRVDNTDKIYHWNPSGGDSVWTLPKTFEGQTTVKVFKLSDLGRTDLLVLDVVDGSVTLTAEPRTAYVVYKGDSDADVTGSLDGLDWSQGSPVRDTGFDSHGAKSCWTTENSEFTNNDHGNTYLTMTGTQEATALQTVTGLTPGQNYQASVWAEVQGRRAVISILDGETLLASNYIDRSNVVYGINHTDKVHRKLQRVWVEFTAPASGTVTLTLTGTAGESDTSYVNWDDVRMVAHNLPDQKAHTYYEDFETTTEGFGVFTSTGADHTHLSETNLPYTNDTVEGRFSLKVRAGEYLRTLPHTIRLKPNTTYKAGLDFVSSSQGNIFVLAAKSDLAREAGDTAAAVVGEVTCVSTGSWTKNPTAVFTFTTGDYEDYYIDITHADAGEYAVDNFFVDEVNPASESSLRQTVEEARKLTEANYTPETWTGFSEALANAEALLQEEDPSQEALQAAEDALRNAWNGLKNVEKDPAAAAVEAQIAALGEITLDSEAAIQAARKAYNDLTEAQKELVKNLATLEAAEAKLQALKNEAAAEALKAAKAAAKAELDKTVSNPRHQVECDTIRAQYKEAIDNAKSLEEVKTLLASAKAQLAKAVLCPSENFKDVKADGWYHEAVDYAIEQGLMKGVSADRFSIDGTLTRGQLVTILYRAEGSPSIEGMKNPFGDIVIAPQNWYAEAVIWAYNNGIVKGVTDVKFAPMAKITREQLVSILYRYDGSYAVEGGLKDFADADKVSGYAKQAMVWGVENGIVSGIPAGGQLLLKPQGNATRAQAAAIMMRFLNQKD